MPIGDKCWKDWTVRLRIEMMRSRTLEVTKTIDEIAAETGTDESIENLRSFGFWNAGRLAKKDWDTIPRNGLDIGFDTNAYGKVDQVTFSLNESWQAVLRRNS